MLFWITSKHNYTFIFNSVRIVSGADKIKITNILLGKYNLPNIGECPNGEEYSGRYDNSGL